MTQEWFLTRVLLLVPLLLSLTVHEFAHAWSAYKLGDDTARRMGRLTLNPLAHMDLFGTFLLPLMGVPFGWAKPVPINPAGFSRNISMSKGMMVTAAAGPVSNLVLALGCVLGLQVLAKFLPGFDSPGSALAQLLGFAFMLNINLAIFNLIPVPPLDGSRILEGILPYRFRQFWENLSRYSFIILILIFFYAGSIIEWPSRIIRGLMVTLVQAVI